MVLSRLVANRRSADRAHAGTTGFGRGARPGQGVTVPDGAEDGPVPTLLAAVTVKV